METRTTKTVAIVEDDQQLREQLMQILAKAPDIRCVGAFASGEEAVKKIPSQNPDVILMDIRLPGMSGIHCALQLKKMNPAVQIIMVTVYKDSERIFKALKAGASGYLLKSGPPAQLLEAVHDVANGGAPISSHIARKFLVHFHSLDPPSKETESLSSREREVLDLLAAGFFYKEIAERLNIGVATVRTYVQRICQKMHVRSRLEAVAKSRRDAE